MSATPSILFLPTGLALIRCTVWLGFVLSACTFFCIGCALWCFGSILFKHYAELYRPYECQNERDPEQSPREVNQLFGLVFYLIRRLRLLLGHEGHKLGQVGSLGGDKVRALPSLHTTNDVSDLGVHKSKHRTMPNARGEWRWAKSTAMQTGTLPQRPLHCAR